jgi:uncharacterized membrane protein
MPFARLPRLLGALGLSSALSVALVAARVLSTGSRAYSFLVWNLFLAWVPFWLALGVAWTAKRARSSGSPRLALAMLVVAWFLFFPNAPYLVTDLIHLVSRTPGPRGAMLYDAVMFFSFAFSGLLTGFLSLRIVEEDVKAAWGRAASIAITILTLAASGLGVTVGRFDRFNSWDVATRPITIFGGILHRITHDPRAMLTTVLFAVFFIVSYVTVTQVVLSCAPPWRTPSKLRNRDGLLAGRVASRSRKASFASAKKRRISSARSATLRTAGTI